jgi:hypothetical protein
MQGKPVLLCLGLFLKFMATFWWPGTPKLSTAMQKLTTLIDSGRDYSNLVPFSLLEQGIWRWQGQL